MNPDLILERNRARAVEVLLAAVGAVTAAKRSTEVDILVRAARTRMADNAGVWLALAGLLDRPDDRTAAVEVVAQLEVHPYRSELRSGCVAARDLLCDAVADAIGWLELADATIRECGRAHFHGWLESVDPPAGER